MSKKRAAGILIGSVILSVLNLSTTSAGQAPEVSAITLSPSNLDVSTSSNFVQIDLEVNSASPLRTQITTAILTKVENGNLLPDTQKYNGRLNLISSSGTLYKFAGKIIVPRQAESGTYGVVLTNAFSDNSGEINSIDFSKTWPTLTIVNNSGPLPAGINSTIPTGVTIEEYLPTSYVAIWNFAQTRLAQNLKLAQDSATAGLENASVFQDILKTVPTTPALTGNATLDVQKVIKFSTDVKFFYESVQDAINKIATRDLIHNKANPTQLAPKPLKSTITCSKGKSIKKVTGLKPTCPKGFKKK